jgi:hypothetical protein
MKTRTRKKGYVYSKRMRVVWVDVNVHTALNIGKAKAHHKTINAYLRSLLFGPGSDK